MTKNNKVKKITWFKDYNIALEFDNDEYIRGEELISNSGIKFKVWNDTQNPAIPSRLYVLSVFNKDEKTGLNTILTKEIIDNLKSFDLYDDN